MFRKWLALICVVGAIAWGVIVFASDYESIRIDDLARTLDRTKVTTGYNNVFITIEGGDIRWRKDGKALVTSTEGHLAINAHAPVIQLKNRKEIMHASFIRATGNTSTTNIRVSYEDN